MAHWASCVSPGDRRAGATSAEHGIDATPGLHAQVARTAPPPPTRPGGEILSGFGLGLLREVCIFFAFLLKVPVPKSLLFDIKVETLQGEIALFERDLFPSTVIKFMW